MVSATRKAFEFLYVHRGQTDLWDLKDARIGSEPEEGEPLGARRDLRDRRQEWYRVVVEPGPDEDPDKLEDRAEKDAEAELKKVHPGHHPASSS